ncbi:hypothetical protein AbraIFM66950_004698 [Aspergillus brasiliensis]|nr:hypothetical protein AbraIFM66950_004698 [Aspergillus brasiliensis]
MSLLKVESHIKIDRSPSAVFDFISSPANWAGLHPGSKQIIGEGVQTSAKTGTRFIEIIDDGNGVKFNAHWVVTRSIKDEFFQFRFPSDYSHSLFHEIVITYDVSQNDDGSTEFTRRMVSWIKPGVDITPLCSFYINDLHNEYVAAVKARVEGN